MENGIGLSVQWRYFSGASIDRASSNPTLNGAYAPFNTRIPSQSYFDLVLTAKIGSLPTKATREKLGPLLAPFEDLMARVEDARPRRLALLAAQRTSALHAFAARFLPDYAARHGLSLASAGYRLAPAVTAREAAIDVAAAVGSGIAAEALG